MPLTHRLRATLLALAVVPGVGCAAGARGGRPASRPALGPGSDWVAAGTDGTVGLCEPRDRPDRLCGWAPVARAERWLGALDGLMRQPAGMDARSTPELRLSGDVLVHVTRNRAGAERPYAIAFADGRRHLARGAPLTTDGGAELLVRLRDAVARARGR